MVDPDSSSYANANEGNFMKKKKNFLLVLSGYSVSFLFVFSKSQLGELHYMSTCVMDLF